LIGPTKLISQNFQTYLTHPILKMLIGLICSHTYGFLSAALYIKYENAMVTVAYFIIAAALLNIVLDQVFLLILGLMTGLTIGILLYHAFIAKEE